MGHFLKHASVVDVQALSILMRPTFCNDGNKDARMDFKSGEQLHRKAILVLLERAIGILRVYVLLSKSQESQKQKAHCESGKQLLVQNRIGSPFDQACSLALVQLPY